MGLKELENLSDEQLRVRCNEICLQSQYGGKIDMFLPCGRTLMFHLSGDTEDYGHEIEMKDYPRCLNACAEFEKLMDVDILSGDSPRYTYSRILYSITPPDEQPFRAKARLRTIAFIFTKSNQ